MTPLIPYQTDDRLLLQQIEEGNKNAFNILYERHWERTYVTAYKRLKDENQAKDIVQEIFTHIWIKRETLHIDNIPAYLNIAVRNRVIKTVSKQKLTHPFFSVLESIPAAHHEADTNLLLKELVLAYEALLNALPPQRQMIFRLRFQEDLPTKEIAVQMGISRKTVQNQLRLAVEQVKVSILQLLTTLVVVAYLASQA